nr:hypothetical protein [Dyella sp. ASV24]
MKKRRLLSSIALCLLLAFSTLATAATIQSQQVTYFNEAGTIIGYQYLDCGNSARHAGTLSSPYSVIQHWVCPGATTTCVWDSTTSNWNCIPNTASTIYKNVAYLHTADGISAKQFCADQVPGNVYANTLSCSATAPEILVGFDPVVGWN